MKRTMLFVSILLLSACTSPCPPVEPPYVCPPDLGTTWGETDAQGCTRYVCSIGGAGWVCGGAMSGKKIVWYCVGDSDPENGHELSVSDRPPHDWGYIAQECAEDYFHNCDGWEDSWPQMVYLRETEDGPIVATFEVHKEAESQFYAYEPKSDPTKGARDEWA